MLALLGCLLTGTILTVTTLGLPTTCQIINRKIKDLSESLILDKTISNCIDQTIIDRDHQQGKQFLEILSTAIEELKYDIIEPMKQYHENTENYLEIYTNLKNIIGNVKSIECKKSIKKKGVMKKIKKYMTTEEPEEVKEEKKIEASYADFDGWTYEHLQLMKQYYAEMQQELIEIKKLCPY